jgi:hypothetical protein
MRSLLLLLPLLSLEAHAKKFALVVGGATNANVGASIMVPETVNPHEFGKSTARSAYGLARQGYEVTTLFDTIDTPQNCYVVKKVVPKVYDPLKNSRVTK